MRAADSSFDAGRAETGKAGEDADERELLDATIKMVRLLANLSIDPETGAQLGTKAAVLQVLVFLCMLHFYCEGNGSGVPARA
jgi:hypothetical protein